MGKGSAAIARGLVRGNTEGIWTLWAVMEKPVAATSKKNRFREGTGFLTGEKSGHSIEA